MIKSVLHTFITKIFSAAFGFLTIIIVSRLLGAEGKGEQAMIVLNIYVLMLLFTLLGNSTLVYLTPRFKFPLLIIPSLVWIMALGLVAVAITILFPSVLPHYAAETIGIAVLASVTEVNQFVLLGKEKIRKANRVKVLSPLITCLLLVIMCLFNSLDTTADFVLALGISYLFSTAYSVFVLRTDYAELTYNRLKTIPKRAFRQTTATMFAKGTTKQCGTIIQTLNYRILFYFLAAYFGEKLVGIYSNAVSLSEAVMLFGSSLALVQYSRLSNLNRTDGEAVLMKRITLKMTAINAFYTVLALLVLCIMPKGVYVWLLGADFESVRYIIRLMAFGILCISCSSNFTQYFASRGNFTISAFASLAGLLITLVFGVLLVPKYGINGAAVTSVVSFAVTALTEGGFFVRWTRKDTGTQEVN